jgi:hypothetical protein
LTVFLAAFLAALLGLDLLDFLEPDFLGDAARAGLRFPAVRALAAAFRVARGCFRRWAPDFF